MKMRNRIDQPSPPSSAANLNRPLAATQPPAPPFPPPPTGRVAEAEEEEADVAATCAREFRIRFPPSTPLCRLPVALAALILTLALFGGFFTAVAAAASTAGYSYTSFVGPVSGPEERVYVHDPHSGATRVDYVARPEYEFAYGVEDAGARVLHNRKETRDGDAVQGVYSVVDPDGTLRVVRYTADNVNGFQAEVITNGVPSLHGHQPADEAQGGGGVAGIAAVGGQVHHTNNNNNYNNNYNYNNAGPALQQPPNHYEVHEGGEEGDGGQADYSEDDGEAHEEEEEDEEAGQDNGQGHHRQREYAEEEEDEEGARDASEENEAFSYEDASSKEAESHEAEQSTAEDEY